MAWRPINRFSRFTNIDGPIFAVRTTPGLRIARANGILGF
jgi:hypothetical protein